MWAHSSVQGRAWISISESRELSFSPSINTHIKLRGKGKEFSDPPFHLIHKHERVNTILRFAPINFVMCEWKWTRLSDKRSYLCIPKALEASVKYQHSLERFQEFLEGELIDRYLSMSGRQNGRQNWEVEGLKVKWKRGPSWSHSQIPNENIIPIS